MKKEHTLGKITMPDLIEKIGAGKAYAIFGDVLGEAVMADFSFKDWRDVFREAPKNGLMSKRAMGAMVRLATTFDDLVWLHLYIEDEAISSDAFQNALRVGQLDDWIGWYKENGVCNNFLDTCIGKRMHKLSQRAVTIMKEITVL